MEDRYLHCTIIWLDLFWYFLRVSGSRTNLFMRFKSTAKSGLLLWRGDSPMRANSDFLSMGLQDGALIFRLGLGLHTKQKVRGGQAPKRGRNHGITAGWVWPWKQGLSGNYCASMKLFVTFFCLSYNLGSGTTNIAVNGTFNDGKWHRVKAVR